MTRPAALLFDLDGTLVDSDTHHHAAFNEVLATVGGSIDAEGYRARVMGKANVAIAAELFPDQPREEQVRLLEAKESAFRRRITGPLEPIPGLVALLDWAHAADVAICVVTNAPRANAVLMLASLGLSDRFGTVVIGDELAHGKPHPLPYLTGLEKLGADPARSVAFEDSLSGLAAARAAGLDVVGLATGHAPRTLVEAGAAVAAKDFTDPAIMDLVRRRTGAA